MIKEMQVFKTENNGYVSINEVLSTPISVGTTTKAIYAHNVKRNRFIVKTMQDYTELRKRIDDKRTGLSTRVQYDGLQGAWRAEQTFGTTLNEYFNELKTSKIFKEQTDYIRTKEYVNFGFDKQTAKANVCSYALISSVIGDGDENRRNKDFVSRLNRLMTLDFDGLENDNRTINDIKNELIQDPYLLAVGLSVSGTGLWGVVVVDVYADNDDFVSLFNALSLYFSHKYNLELDKACKDYTRLRYNSFDPDFWVCETESIKIWNQRAEQTTAKKDEKEIKIIDPTTTTQANADDIIETCKTHKFVAWGGNDRKDENGNYVWSFTNTQRWQLTNALKAVVKDYHTAREMYAELVPFLLNENYAHRKFSSHHTPHFLMSEFDTNFARTDGKTMAWAVNFIMRSFDNFENIVEDVKNIYDFSAHYKYNLPDDNHLSDIFNDVVKNAKNAVFNYVVAPCGIGKTRTIIKYAEQVNNAKDVVNDLFDVQSANNDIVIAVCPLNSICEDSFSGLQNWVVVNSENENRKNMTDYWLTGRNICTSYDMFISREMYKFPNVRAVFIDEAHVMYENYDYRTDTMRKMLDVLNEIKEMNNDVKVFLFSATPNAEIYDVKNFGGAVHEISWYPQKNKVQANINIVNNTQRLETLREDVRAWLNADVNNYAVVYYAQTNQKFVENTFSECLDDVYLFAKQHKENVQGVLQNNGVLPVSHRIFCYSVYAENGVNFRPADGKKYRFFYYAKENNATEIVQSASRLRANGQGKIWLDSVNIYVDKTKEYEDENENKICVQWNKQVFSRLNNISSLDLQDVKINAEMFTTSRRLQNDVKHTAKFGLISDARALYALDETGVYNTHNANLLYRFIQNKRFESQIKVIFYRLKKANYKCVVVDRTTGETTTTTANETARTTAWRKAKINDLFRRFCPVRDVITTDKNAFFAETETAKELSKYISENDRKYISTFASVCMKYDLDSAQIWGEMLSAVQGEICTKDVKSFIRCLKLSNDLFRYAERDFIYLVCANDNTTEAKLKQERDNEINERIQGANYRQARDIKREIKAKYKMRMEQMKQTKQRMNDDLAKAVAKSVMCELNTIEAKHHADYLLRKDEKNNFVNLTQIADGRLRDYEDLKNDVILWKSLFDAHKYDFINERNENNEITGECETYLYNYCLGVLNNKRA